MAGGREGTRAKPGNRLVNYKCSFVHESNPKRSSTIDI